MDQRIHQQLFQHLFGDFQLPQRVEASPGLHMAQIAADEGKAALVLLQQRPVDVFAIQVTAIVQGGAGEGDGFYLKRWPVALRLLAEQQQAGQIQLAPVAQPEVLQQLFRRQPGQVAVLAVAAVEVGVKGFIVEIDKRCAGYRYYIGVYQSGALEQALQFFARRYMALVRAGLDPYPALQVHIRLVEAVGHADCQHQPMRGGDVFGQRVQRWPNALAGGIADQLVQTPHRSGIQPGNAAVISHAETNLATAAIGHGRQFGGQSIDIGDITLELVPAIFATGQHTQQLGFSHGLACARWVTQ